jgi:putative transposase
MTGEPSRYRRHRFHGEIISYAVWLYHLFSLSLRDIELILAERGVVVTHESIRHWCRKFGADFAFHRDATNGLVARHEGHRLSARQIGQYKSNSI